MAAANKWGWVAIEPNQGVVCMSAGEREREGAHERTSCVSQHVRAAVAPMSQIFLNLLYNQYELK